MSFKRTTIKAGAVIFLFFLLIKGCLIPVINWARFNYIDESKANKKIEDERIDYNNLFVDDIAKDLVLSRTFVSKNNNVIFSFNYKNQYTIIAHSVGYNEGIPFNKLIKMYKRDAQRPEGIYQGFEGIWKFSYSSVDDPVVNAIDLQYDYKLLKEKVYNDKLVNVQVSASQIAIKYGQQYADAMILEHKKNKYLGANISILKVDNKIYLFLIYPHDENDIMSVDFILEILKRRYY